MVEAAFLYACHVANLFHTDMPVTARVEQVTGTVEQHLAANPQVLTVFQGAHAYVSPTWYEGAGVLTWNYTAVHPASQRREKRTQCGGINGKTILMQNPCFYNS